MALRARGCATTGIFAVVACLLSSAASTDENLAVGRSVTCECPGVTGDCFEGQNIPGRMTDGMESTYWVSATSKSKYECVLQLDSVVNVGRVVLKYKDGNLWGFGQSRTCSGWSIEVSDNGIVYTQVPGWSGVWDTHGRNEESLSKSGGVKASHLRFVCSKMNSQDIRIAEWQVFEAALSTTNSAPARATDTQRTTTNLPEELEESEESSATMVALITGLVVFVVLVYVCVCVCSLCFLSSWASKPPSTSASRPLPMAKPAKAAAAPTPVVSVPVPTPAAAPAVVGKGDPFVQPASLNEDAAEEHGNWSVSSVRNPTEMDALRSILYVPDRHNLGWGRDVKAKERYTSLEVVHAWKIHKPSKRNVYDAKKQQVESEMRLAKKTIALPIASTKLDPVGNQIGVDATLNEKILLHGTKPEMVLAVLQNGLNERLSGGTFGAGSYLAEDPSKIDQYCTPDLGPSSGDRMVDVLHQKIYKDVSHPGRVFYCFVVRVVLGIPVFTKDGEVNMSAPDQSVWLTADKRELAVIPGTIPPVHYHTLIAECGGEGYKVKRHREFVTFSGDRTILEYLIAYKRV